MILFTISTSDILFMDMVAVILGTKIYSAMINLKAHSFYKLVKTSIVYFVDGYTVMRVSVVSGSFSLDLLANDRDEV